MAIISPAFIPAWIVVILVVGYIVTRITGRKKRIFKTFRSCVIIFLSIILVSLYAELIVLFPVQDDFNPNLWIILAGDLWTWIIINVPFIGIQTVLVIDLYTIRDWWENGTLKESAKN
ncbi:MAG: hypothetical protein ACFFF4_14740 [Candidatus Thorarchaeota archaeon]